MDMDAAADALVLEHRRLQSDDAPVITSLLLSGDRIIIANSDSKIRVYSIEKGSLSYMLEGHVGGVWSVDVLDDTLASGSTDNIVRIWDLQSGRCTHIFEGHTATVRCIKITRPERTAAGTDDAAPKQPLVVSCSRDCTLRVWKLPSREDREVVSTEGGEGLDVGNNPYHRFLLEGHTSAIRALAVHGRIAISGSYDCSVRVWDVEKGKVLWTLEGHTQKVYSVAYDAVRNHAYSGSMDSTVRVWNLDDGQCIGVLAGHTSLVGHLSISPNSLVSAAANATLKIWNPNTNELKYTLAAHTITAVAHDDDKMLTTSGTSGESLLLWNTRDGTVIRDMWPEVGGQKVWQVALEGLRCVAASTSTEATFIDIWTLGDLGEGRRDIDGDIVVRGFVVVPRPTTHEGA